MPRLGGRAIRTNVKTMDDVRRSLQMLDLSIQTVVEEGSGFMVKITDYVALTANRWAYSGYRQRYSSTGAGEWEDDPAHPDLLEFCIYNTIETNNVATAGIRGNSVNSAGEDYPDGFYLQPVGGLKGQDVDPHQVVTRCWRVSDLGEQGEYAICYENSDDGVCSIDQGLLVTVGSEETFVGMNNYESEALFAGF